MILKNGEYRPKNDFYFCYIFHVSKIVSFCLRAEKPSLDWSAVKRFPRILPKADAWECTFGYVKLKISLITVEQYVMTNEDI